MIDYYVGEKLCLKPLYKFLICMVTRVVHAEPRHVKATVFTVSFFTVTINR